MRRLVKAARGFCVTAALVGIPAASLAQQVEIPRPDLMGPAGLFLHQSWTAQARSLPDLSVRRIVPLPSGMLLVSMAHGTYRFDGLTFNPLWSPLTSAATGALSIGNDSAIVTTEFRVLRGPICCGPPTSNTTILLGPRGKLSTTGDPTTALTVERLVEVGDTALIILDRGRRLIRMRRDGTMEAIPVPPGEVLTSVSASVGWQFVGGKALYRVSGDRLLALAMPASLPPVEITALGNAPDDHVVVGTKAGDILLLRVSGAEVRLVLRARPAGPSPVTTVLSDPYRGFWVGFGDEGVAYFDGREWRRVRTRDGLSGDAVTALAGDAEGDVWVGTNGGLDRFRRREIRVLTTSSGLASSFVQGVTLSADSTLFALPDGDWLQRLDGGSGFHRVPGPQRGAWPRMFNSIVSLRDGSELMALSSQRYQLFRDGRVSALSPLPPDASTPPRGDVIASLVEAPPGDLWMGLVQRGGVLHQKPDGTVERFDRKRGVDFTWVFELGIDSHGDVWAFGPEGAARRSGGDFERVWSTPPGTEITCALVDGDLIWIGQQDGVHLLVDGRLRRLDGIDVPSVAVQSFVNDGRGHVWFGAADGLWRLDRAGAVARMRTGRGDVHARRFDRYDGLLSEEFNTNTSAVQVHTLRGRIFVATAGGVVVADPDWFMPNVAPPKPRVLQVLVGDSAFAAGDSLTRQVGQGVVTFEFAVPALRSPEKTRVEYRLDGVDREWRRAGLNRRAVYGGLTGRSYRFRLRAFNEDGVPSAADATMELRLIPPLTQRWPFRVLMSLLVLVVVYAAVRLREQQLRQRQQQLERIVDDRTRELRELSSRRLESIGRLAGGVAHDLNSLLTVVMGTAHLLHDDVPVAQQPDVKEIIGAAERAGRLTAQLLTFASRQIVLPASFDAGELVRGMLASIRKAAGAAVNVEFDDADGPLPVFADRSQVEQAVINLTDNAREAMPDGGTLRIRLSLTDLPDSPGRPAGAWIVIAVNDTGIGMNTETMQQLFDPFFTTKPVGQGTGMGLATTYGVVQQWGGFIEVASEIGVGSTVTMLLPLLLDRDATDPSHASVASTA